MNIDNGKLTMAITQNQVVPSEGSRAVTCILDFTALDVYELDLSSYMQEGRISQVQTVFIDMKDAAVPLQLTVNGTGQVIQAKPQTQGYYNVLCSNPAKLTFTCAGGPIMRVFLINVPIPGATWSTQ